MTQRFIRDVVTPAAPQALTDGMSHRTLIAPGNWTDYDPFLVLAEDWMRGQRAAFLTIRTAASRP